MQRLPSSLVDPMIAVLVSTTILAALVPASGEAHEFARGFSNVSIFVLFLVNGMRIPREEVLKAAANWRFFLALLVFVFLAMAFAGAGFAALAEAVLPPAIALGFVFLGVLPSTIQSATSYTTLARGNAALSVVGAALLNIIGVFASAPLFALLAGGDIADLGSETFLRIGMILLLPFLIGQALQGFARRWLVERRSRLAWLDRAVIGIAVYVAMSGAITEGSLSGLNATEGLAVFVLTILFLALAHGASWKLSGWLGCPRGDRIAFVFAAPQKSVAIGAPLAAIMFQPGIAGAIILPLLLYHLLQLILAAPLATRLARPPAD